MRSKEESEMDSDFHLRHGWTTTSPHVRAPLRLRTSICNRDKITRKIRRGQVTKDKTVTDVNSKDTSWTKRTHIGASYVSAFPLLQAMDVIRIMNLTMICLLLFLPRGDALLGTVCLFVCSFFFFFFFFFFFNFIAYLFSCSINFRLYSSS